MISKQNDTLQCVFWNAVLLKLKLTPCFSVYDKKILIEREQNLTELLQIAGQQLQQVITAGHCEC